MSGQGKTLPDRLIYMKQNKYLFLYAGSIFHNIDSWIFRVKPSYLDQIESLLRRKETMLGTDLTQKHSDISILSLGPYNKCILIKKIKFQIAADYLRRYIGRSQAFREFIASTTLLSIKVRCPIPISYGVNLSPFGQYESLYVGEYIENSINGVEFLIEEKGIEERNSFLSAVAQDLATIHNNGFFHKDSHFGNILCKFVDPTKIFWIDNDLKKIKSLRNKYERVALGRFQKILRHDIISFNEWYFFIENYFSNLKK